MTPVARWSRRLLTGLLGAAVLAVGTVYGVSEYRLRRSYDVPLGLLSLAPAPDAVARGKHVATIRGCMDCHGTNLAGKNILDVTGVATLFSSNLTRGRGGVGAAYSDADWVRAIRHGVGPDRKPLLAMPSQEFHVLSDEDVSALVAFLKSLPPVDNELGENRVGPMGRALFVAGRLPVASAEVIDHSAPRPEAPPAAPTAEYGAYLATGCIGCHGEGLSGGKVPGTPADYPLAANLTPDRDTGIGGWTEGDFVRALRQGVRPDGSTIRPEMPWQLTQHLTDDELRALWLYLGSVPPRAEGNR